MRLWNDYEGTTIADAYPIEKLIRPEGRSAFFSTRNGTGTPAVIRLIESINDESEILKRWKAVAELQEDHLVTLKKFGQTVFEGTPLIYVLMERTEIDLASILQQGSLSADETRQIATSLVEAVGALHAAGIVHEHIEPMNVLALGETVKLRSDCIRETPEGDEGIALIKQDVHDIAVVLLQALTQRKSLDTIGSMRLPAPFDAIIRNGISGKWGLAQIAAALNPPAAAVVAASTSGGGAAPKPVAAGASTPAAAGPPPAATPARAEQLPLEMPDAASAKPKNEPLSRERINVPVEDEEAIRRKRLRLAIAVAVLVVLAVLGWHFSHKSEATNQTPITTLSDAGRVQSRATRAPAPSAAVAPVPQPAQGAGEDASPWRVIAFTYNHQDQAQHKVDELAQKDASLRPEVFNPNGGSSYLVTVGGTMTREAALAFRQKATREGLPSDTYIQNYGRRTRRRR